MTATEKPAYLTIDDSPTSAFAEKVDYLAARGIPAVFFCIGELVEQCPAAVIDAIRRGFVIGNHSHTHPAFSKTPLPQCRAEIARTDAIIDRLYAEAGVERPARWFRFPYGDKGDGRDGRVLSRWRWRRRRRGRRIQAMLTDLDYTQPPFPDVTYRYMRRAGLYDDVDWSWTFDAMEWALAERRPTQGLGSLDAVLARIRQERPRDCRGAIGREPRWLRSPSAEVILLHDHEETHAAFYAIVDELLELPLRFRDFADLY